MKKNYQLTVGLLLALMLGGCTDFHTDMNSFSRNNTAYMKSRSVPDLEVPGDLSRTKVGDDYRIPPSNAVGLIPAPVVSPYVEGKAR